MSINTLPTQQGKKVDLTAAIIRRFVQIMVVLAVEMGVFFLAAGRLDWPMAWVYCAICLGVVAVNALILLPKSPDLIAERSQTKADSKGWDKWLSVIVSLIGPLIMFIVAGLDVRFGWSPQITLPAQLVALALIVAGYGIWIWAMSANKFFSGVVRIQKDRGQITITDGPYHFVRHPAYIGMVLYTLAIPVLFGAIWALVPAVLDIGALVIRTSLEDQTLQNELDGYKDYARQVRYRLVPGLW